MKSLTWQVPLWFYAAGDVLDMQSSCVVQLRAAMCCGGSDGTSKTATSMMEDFEGQNVPIRKGRYIYVNRIKSVVNGSGSYSPFTNAAVSKSLLPAL